MFKLIKKLSRDYDNLYSVEVNTKTGEIYFRPFWYKYLTIILEIMNIIFLPITLKSYKYNRKEYSVLIPWYNFKFKGKHWVYLDYFN